MKYPHTYILIPYTKDRRGRVREALAAIEENTDPEITPHSVVLYENNYIGYPNAILDMVDKIDGFVFMGASDLIMGKDWLRILWETMEKYQRLVAVEPYNEIQQGNICQHPLLHSSLVKHYFNRHYFHYYADNEMDERLRADQLYVYCPAAPMEHRHIVNGKAEMDEGYKVVFDRERNLKDKETFERRKAAGWPE